MLLPIRQRWSFDEGFNTITVVMSATGIPNFLMDILSENLIADFAKVIVVATDKYEAKFLMPETENNACKSGELYVTTKLIFKTRDKCSECMKYFDSLRK